MATSISHSPAETEAIGECWGRAAKAREVIALTGDLGAGKTQLVKGIARGLDIKTRVHSPTFNLVNIYTGGRFTLYHLDLYRLETRDQITAAGLEEYLAPDGVTVIEWAEKWFGAGEKPDRGASIQYSAPKAFGGIQLPKAFLWVRIETLSETERRIIYENSGR